ncbi:ATP-dependent DNA helicase RecG [Jeotgalicoccus halotolerans]|uniref:ATP-dependent DNA helicase RecG n=1 Tax=Jeotgalicoccus halotolerans TaxID=157227 RepID=A0A3E0ATN0_9STAP|nr:ATP-dependent DNA helicase RecG [Jeotgalicoccus halotolerans]REG23098.1 ATP-dependent DNA helicase RecG [Jeotgalicoccus halotolerans]
MSGIHVVQSPDRNIKELKGVGDKVAEKLFGLGITGMNDVLFHLPAGYIDHSVVNLNEAPDGANITIEGTVKTEPQVAFFRRGKSRLTFFMDVDGIYVKITFFNQPYLKSKIINGEFARLYGKFNRNKLEINGTKLIFEAGGGYQVKYPLGGVMQSKTFQKIVRSAFDMTNFNVDLPEALRAKYKLMPVRDALYALHFPDSHETVAAARRTIKFYELYHYQLKIMERRQKERVRSDRFVVDYKIDELKTFIDTLPFELTGDQKKSVNDICRDFKQNISMHRLLQGDVGSGKTIVAGICVYAVKTIGEQSAVMVPTEVLANQHYESFKDTYGEELTIAKLTGTTKPVEKRDILARLATGEIDLLVGTHSLIEDDVIFSRLSFIIIDEQHRFGVNQREKLNNKAYRKNVLYMTATPIPRTLSITSYGDMDVSVIREMPKGRIPIETEWRRFKEIDYVLSFVKSEIDKGHSAYIVAPLIEESETLDLKNVYEIYEIFEEYFSPDDVVLVHGRMKAEEKNAAMRSFETLEKPLLVSTTVIEVGINVPNATAIVIFNAERFGLSTLHQLRGRVGRSSKKSYCVLVSDPATENAKQRMDIMTSTSDGFVLSERDLEMRGPGDYFGVRQSGLPQFKIADITEDYRILEVARDEAVQVYENNNL